MQWLVVDGQDFVTFFQRFLIGGLSVRKYSFHVDAHRTLRRIRAAYDAEAQALVARAFLELDRHYRETRILAATPRQRIETIAVVFSALQIVAMTMARRDDATADVAVAGTRDTGAGR